MILILYTSKNQKKCDPIVQERSSEDGFGISKMEKKHKGVVESSVTPNVLLELFTSMRAHHQRISPFKSNKKKNKR